MKSYIFSLLILLAIACKKDDIQVNFNYNEFLHMKSKWEQFNVKDYSYTYSSLGFGCFSNKYTVKYNLVEEVEPDTLICYHGMDSSIKYTIDDIFQKINYRYNNPIIEQSSEDTYWYCYEIAIEYDSAYFFPKRYEFKQKGKNMTITDMERIQTITDFRAN